MDNRFKADNIPGFVWQLEPNLMHVSQILQSNNHRPSRVFITKGIGPRELNYLSCYMFWQFSCFWSHFMFAPLHMLNVLHSSWSSISKFLNSSCFFSAFGYWVPLRPSDSDLSQNWKPRTREILLLSLQLGAIEAQWFWLLPELEARARDQGDFPTLTAVGCHWGPVILTSARIGSPGPGRFPYSHCSWVPLRPSDSDFGQNWKPGTREIPLLSLQFGAIEAQWFRHRPELEARDRGDSPTLFKWSQGVL
jgi:hypothetical protein